MSKKNKSLIIILVCLFFLPFLTKAQLSESTLDNIQQQTIQTGVESGVIESREVGEKASVQTTTLKIVQYALSLLATIMVIMILWAGIQIMFSGGNSEKIKAGKKTIINAVAGLAIILVSFSGTVLLTKRLNKVFTSPKVGDACRTDEDCPIGTRCAPQLLARSVCAPWGTNTLTNCQECQTDSSCGQGAICVDGSMIRPDFAGKRCCWRTFK